MTEPLHIVLDTNVLLASIGTSSPYRWVFDAILDGEVGLCVSTPLLREYEAVIARKTKLGIAENVLRAFLLLPNVRRVRISYRWHLIEEDPDDNVFVDTALAGGAHAIVIQVVGYALYELRVALLGVQLSLNQGKPRLSRMFDPFQRPVAETLTPKPRNSQLGSL